MTPCGVNSIQAFLRAEAVWIPDSHYLLTAWTDDRQMKSPSVIEFTPVDGSIRPRVIDYRQSLARRARKRAGLFDTIATIRVPARLGLSHNPRGG